MRMRPSKREHFDFDAPGKGLSERQEMCLDGEVSYADCVSQFMRDTFCYALIKTEGNQAAAARLLGLNRTTFVEILAREAGRREKEKRQNLD